MRNFIEIILYSISNAFDNGHVDMSYMWDGTLDIKDNDEENIT